MDEQSEEENPMEYRSMKKKVVNSVAIVVLLMTVISVLCFTSCSEIIPEPTHQREPATYQRNITGKDVFEKGYYYESLGSHSKVTVRKLDPDSYVTWKVYFTKDVLPEEEIEKLLERTPDITNAGEFNAYQYDYVYFFCDVNSKNSPEPTDDMIMLKYMATYA